MFIKLKKKETFVVALFIKVICQRTNATVGYKCQFDELIKMVIIEYYFSIEISKNIYPWVSNKLDETVSFVKIETNI